MAAVSEQDPPVYVLTVDAVRWALGDLRERKIHTFFLAYLFLRKWSIEQETTTDIAPHWDELAEFIAVPGGPPDRPYYRPLWQGKANDPARYWMNRNIAGSYATSSLRAGQPPMQVIGKAGSHFVLRENHAALAVRHLLFGKPVPILAVATYLYRDFGIQTEDGGTPEPSDLFALFMMEFHYDGPGDADLSPVFSGAGDSQPADAWFEPLTPDTAGVG
ncbi:MAG TPA: hypothetical protein VN238_06035 [Solirubrobacteraceae bacterium]|nr:hypothetical protein [Solirubrobacteraceae bacterium]